MVSPNKQQSLLQQAINHYHGQKSEYINKLKELIQIPSVSFPDFPRQPLFDCANAIKIWLNQNHIPDVELIRVGRSVPYILANIASEKGKPTVLMYAHYDVQPQLRRDYWKSDPFTGVEKDGRLFGRGSADDKAGIVLHIASVLSYLSINKKCPVNVQLLFEGEEETGSIHMENFLKTYGHKLKGDIIIVADSANFDVGIPGLTTSLRGLTTIDVEVSSLSSPLHSGMWGGPIPDPVFALSKMISTLIDENGLPAVPGLMEMADEINPQDAEAVLNLPMTDQLFRKQSGLLPGVQLHAKDAANLLRVWRQPAITINAFEAGSRKSGNVLMDKAWARIGIRLVPGMDPQKAAGLLINHLKNVCPWGLKLHTNQEAGADAWITNTRHPSFQIAKDCLEKAYGHPVYTMGSGGSIPLVLKLSEHLSHPPVLLTGIEDPYTNAHSENESLHLGDFHRAVDAQIRFLFQLGLSQ